MSGTEEQVKLKVIGCRVTEEELQNFITPIMHDCYSLGLIKHDTVSSFVKFCINLWIGHYYNKKHEFEMRAQDIENEKKKLAEIAAERKAWEKSPARVVERATKQIEELSRQQKQPIAMGCDDRAGHHNT